jgi:hypothetical protein
VAPNTAADVVVRGALGTAVGPPHTLYVLNVTGFWPGVLERVLPGMRQFRGDPLMMPPPLVHHWSTVCNVAGKEELG